MYAGTHGKFLFLSDVERTRNVSKNISKNPKFQENPTSDVTPFNVDRRTGMARLAFRNCCANSPDYFQSRF
jgi:hypothetical protein